MDISDGSSYKSLPVVLKDVDDVLDAHKLKVGQSVSITGTVSESKGSQDYELLVQPAAENHDLSVIGDVEDTYPIQKKVMTLPYLRHHPSLRHRTSTLSSVLRVRSLLESKFIDFFTDQGFVKVAPPILTGADCEGAGEQFEVDPANSRPSTPEEKFFGRPAYLTVSTQLHLEVLAASLNRVWTLAPCFRAEDSNTNRHLSEFWLLEAEISYITKLEHLTDFSESMIRHVTQALVDRKPEVLEARYSDEDKKELENRWRMVLSDGKWPRITYAQALELINDHMIPKGSAGKVVYGDSILTEHEKWLAGEYFQKPVFITDYPKHQKPFYMPNSANYDSHNPTVACFDLIFPHIGELVGGSLRHHDYDLLVQEMKSRGMKVAEMQWYLTLRQNGTTPHGGFGMGFERFISFITGLDNIRDVVVFPRSPELCDA